MLNSFLVAALVASFVFAQNVPANLSPCVITCLNGVEGNIVSQFGCSQGDFACYCSQPQFGYGIRDCSAATCSDGNSQQQAISYESSFCASALKTATQTLVTTKGGSKLTLATSSLGTSTIGTDSNAGKPRVTQTTSTKPNGDVTTITHKIPSATVAYSTVVTTEGGSKLTLVINPTGTSTLGTDSNAGKPRVTKTTSTLPNGSLTTIKHKIPSATEAYHTLVTTEGRSKVTLLINPTGTSTITGDTNGGNPLTSKTTVTKASTSVTTTKTRIESATLATTPSSIAGQKGEAVPLIITEPLHALAGIAVGLIILM